MAGTCTGINTYGDLRQVVYISKTLTVRGGYTTTNWTAPDPVANLTTLDALGQGRVMVITGEISPTVEGLRLTGGDPAGLGGGIWGEDDGGGLYVVTATATISGNEIVSNTVYGNGGGVYLSSTASTLTGNHIGSNTAENGGGGGGLYLQDSAATLSGNIIGGNAAGSGGGLMAYFSNAAMSGNTISANSAWDGGGIYLSNSSAALSRNTFISNTAEWWGGGLYLYDHSNVRQTNGGIAGNQAGEGAGLYVVGASIAMAHTTLARNSGSSGIYVAGSATLTNTILVSHSVGIYVADGASANLVATLWGGDAWANKINWDGPGTVNHRRDYTGGPAFTDPDGGDYHIALASAAVDRGVDAGVTEDVDGDTRPQGIAPDLGVDELIAPHADFCAAPLVEAAR